MWKAIAVVVSLVAASPALAGGETKIGKLPPATRIVEVKSSGEPVYDLSGDIEAGADDAFIQLVSGREGGWLELRSLGGDVGAAINIGRIAHRHHIKTYVPENTLCLSACAIIWAGGSERWVAKGATLGFHHPWHLEDGKVVEGDASVLVNYYRWLGFSRVVIERFMWAPQTFYYLDGDSAEILGIAAHFTE